eukprot:468937-Prymnesium_polylepis.1
MKRRERTGAEKADGRGCTQLYSTELCMRKRCMLECCVCCGHCRALSHTRLGVGLGARKLVRWR